MVLDLLFLSWLFFLSWLYFCPLRRVNMRMAMTAAVHVTPTTTPIMMYVVVVCDNSRRESLIIRSMVMASCATQMCKIGHWIYDNVMIEANS